MSPGACGSNGFTGGGLKPGVPPASARTKSALPGACTCLSVGWQGTPQRMRQRAGDVPALPTQARSRRARRACISRQLVVRRRSLAGDVNVHGDCCTQTLSASFHTSSLQLASTARWRRNVHNSLLTLSALKFVSPHSAFRPVLRSGPCVRQVAVLRGERDSVASGIGAPHGVQPACARSVTGEGRWQGAPVARPCHGLAGDSARGGPAHSPSPP